MKSLPVVLWTCSWPVVSAFHVPSSHTALTPRIFKTVLFETVEEFTTASTATKAPIQEIQRRRNLAIISHPDSGKTTMTEKLLLYGGALQQAGAVRQKAEQRATQSDFMEWNKNVESPLVRPS